MDQFPKWHFGWIVHKIFYIPIITPYDIYQPTHQICFKPQSCGVVLLSESSKGICNFWFVVNKKQLWGNPLMHFFLRWWHLVPLPLTIQWWHHLLQVPKFTPIAHAYVHNMWFVCQQMQHNVILGQVVVQNSTMIYYIDNLYECPCKLHTILPKATSHVCPSKSSLTCQIKEWL
jgi:hypothetical protein